MTQTDITTPDGELFELCKLEKWCKGHLSEVTKGEVIAIIGSVHATCELEAPQTGVLRQGLTEGHEIVGGESIGSIEHEMETSSRITGDQSKRLSVKALMILALALIAVITATIVIPMKNEGFFITELGEYRLNGKASSISVFQDSNGMLNIRTQYPGEETTWGEGWIDPNESWFIYVDKVNEVWLNHGNKVAYIYSLESVSGIHSVNLYPNAKFKGTTLINLIPPEVLDRLSPATLEGIGELKS